MKTMSTNNAKRTSSFSSKILNSLSGFLHNSKVNHNAYYPYKENFYYADIDDLKIRASKHMF